MKVQLLTRIILGDTEHTSGEELDVDEYLGSKLISKGLAVEVAYPAKVEKVMDEYKAAPVVKSAAKSGKR